MNPERRALRYQSLDEVVSDVDRLALGHRVVGKWTLAQICRHLASTMRRVVDLPCPENPDTSQWVSPERRREVFETGVLDEGLPAPVEILPPEGLDLATEIEGYKQAIAHYKASPGPRMPHRFFGFLPREDWDRLQLIHAAHHLSFAIPTQATV